ncbi:Hypothetical predicted protein [Octopus vulgaris]|uniref:DUF4371 domain-containing protein n=1 Tax=Octopus vulgaris TaxID=6645 RepID=A0AA36EZ28_OCTVU|nr:Hypothetical predicted protein [Octopus vulgaris]
MDQSTLRDSEVVLLTYARHIDKDDFAEKMTFCNSLESTTTATDIYDKLLNYLNANNVPIENIASCAADGAPIMMGKKKGCLELMKDENPEMFVVYCVIHTENFVYENMTPVLNEVQKSVVKCINSIKANAKCERLFKQLVRSL